MKGWRLAFIASETHCSDIIAHLLLDGTEVYVSGVLSPDESTGVRAEGVFGGCNDGDLEVWSGTLKISSGVCSPVSETEVIRHQNQERRAYNAHVSAERTRARPPASFQRAALARHQRDELLQLRAHWRVERRTGCLTDFEFTDFVPT